MAKSDQFLEEAIHPQRKAGLTYMDGFRFGFGAFIAVLLGVLIVGGVALAAVKYLNLA
jgi:hypothetical protein